MGSHRFISALLDTAFPQYSIKNKGTFEIYFRRFVLTFTSIFSLDYGHCFDET